MAKVWSGTKNLVGKPFNRGHKTDDADYKAFEQAFTSQYKALQSLNKDVNSFLCSIDDFVNKQKAISNNIRGVAKEGSTFSNLLSQEQELAQSLLDHKKNVLERDVKALFLDPVANFTLQHKEIQDRIKERNHRESEMRKHEANVEKFQKKDDVKLPHEQARLESCIESFDDLNNELKKDIPALIADTDLFMASAFSQFVQVRANFFGSMSDHNKSMLTILNLSPHPQQQVITSREHSAASRAYTVTSGGSSAVSPRVVSPASSATLPSPNPYAQPLPPPPPARLRQARAMWDYNAQNSNELSIKAGDVINLIDNTGDWWKGELNGAQGFLPGNYVQMLC